MDSKSTPNTIEELIELIDSLKSQGEIYEQKFSIRIEGSSVNYQNSARNLLHYIALRKNDIRELQTHLGHLGISRLGKAEMHIRESINAVKTNLIKINELPHEAIQTGIEAFINEKQILNAHTDDLLGPLDNSDRQTRIMVTLPLESSFDSSLVKKMLKSGMDIARINCAHDNEEVWSKMISNVRSASEKLNKPCKISMDLGGPKLRTGDIEQGPRVQKIPTSKNAYGQTSHPTRVIIKPFEANDEHEIVKSSEITLFISANDFEKIKLKDIVSFRDTRNKARSLTVEDLNDKYAVLSCAKTSYVSDTTRYNIKRNKEIIASGFFKNIAFIEGFIMVNTGDVIIISNTDEKGKNAIFNNKKELISNAMVSCQVENLYTDTKAGEKIIFDDGEIEGKIIEIRKDKLFVKITYTKPEGAKLKADKGINLPNSNLQIQGLTDKDRQDLKFICKNADMVNFSFVNSACDVHDLYKEFEKLNAPKKLGVIYKIETKKGFNNLPNILLTAFKRDKIGVMIARGDLAVECGWQNLAEIQEELLRICEAAHVPIIWATQVLENLAKKGRPSRAEISDASLGQRAECVMLNKGPYIIHAIKTLDSILCKMAKHRNKKASMLPNLNITE
ncbi:pyruvate kinase [Aureibacter tunicatorum]|uniref:pyruvate kinase n=1 Tax=Aureibacter tunicatorum TaxID=866807 RepID=A0AAE4BRY3_9BACT|nr:pyruvate kinase [Aureibacter tunicatorum]MDR6239186.1 pyruvate kinase [Aureibacter tunicatorum]BDD04888.1 pyruvate kinase [Aureibacter tunicatorum]